MPGLMPGIHVFNIFSMNKDVDGRDTPGHDYHGMMTSNSQTIRSKGIAGLHGALLVAGHEPALALRG
jgi:hypothetical protein